jgi:plastocyanin
MRRTLQALATSLSIVAALSAPLLAQAGQVRVTVGGVSNVFDPQTVTVNEGDHVCWVWTGGFHGVTSGTPGDCMPDGAFDSGNRNTSAIFGAGFSFRFTTADPDIDYYCEPHCFEGMVGTVIVVPSGAPVAEFRITELQVDAAGNLDLFEITNLGTASGDLGRYRFVSSTSNDTAMVPAASWVVPVGGRVTVHVNAAGAQTVPTQLYLPTFQALNDVSGHLAILAPNTVVTGTFDSNQMIDYVQWGTGSGQSRESAAVTAGLWTTGHFLPVVPGQSMQFCGTADDHNQTFWASATSTFGAVNDCTTPATPITWGRVKILYR